MKKHRFGLNIVALITTIMLVVGIFPMQAAAESNTWDQNFLITRAVAAKGAPVLAIGDSVEYTMLQGDFFGSGALRQFSIFQNGSPMMLGSEALPVCVWPWQIKATAGTDFVMKVTARQDVYLQLWQDADTSSYWVNNMQISYVVEDAEGNRVTLKTLTVIPNETITTAQYDTRIHMAAGDTAYLIYHMTSATGTYPSNMRITADSEAYDASLRTDFTPESEDPEDQPTEPEITEPEVTEPVISSNILKHTDMVSAQVAAQGEPVAAAGVTYQYLYGDLQAGQMYAFSQFSGNGSGGSNDVVGDGSGDNAVWRWQWRAGNAYDTILRITAAEDVKLSLSHPDAIPVGEIWAFHSSFVLYAADEAGHLVNLTEYLVEKPMNLAAVDEVIHMAAGDSIYLVYGLRGYGNGQVTAGFMPWFTVNPDGYVESLRPDFGTEPDATEPEVTEPEVTEPEATEPQPTEPATQSHILMHTDMVSAQVAAQGEPVVAQGVTYQYLYGDVKTGQINAFTKFSGDGSGSTGDVVGDGSGDNVVWRWQWRAADAYDTMVRITATEDIKLSLSHPNNIPEHEIWAFHSSFILYTADEAGKLVMLTEYLVEKPMNLAAVDEVIHMAAGDSIYLVYGLKGLGNGQVTAGFLPCFTVDSNGYDASLRTDFANAPDAGEPNPGTPSEPKPDNGVVLEHPDMVSAQVAAGGQVVQHELIEYQYLIGDFFKGSLSPFTIFTGSGQGGSNDMLGNANAGNAVWRWQWRCGSKQTVLRVTAKQDMALTLSAAAIPLPQWAAGTAYYVVAENASGEQVLLKTINVSASMHAGSPLTVHLAQGAKLYIIYSNSYGVYDDASPATSDFMPKLSMNTGAYNSASAPAYNGKVSKPAASGQVEVNRPDESMNTDTHAEIFCSDLVSEEVQLKGGVIAKHLADFQFLVGDFFRGGQLQPFAEFSGSGNYVPEDVVGNRDGTNFVYRWQWRSMSYTNTVLKITAKENLRLTIDQRGGIADEQWATHTTFAYVVESVTNDRLTVHQMIVKSFMDEEYMKTEIHLAEGESLYIVYYVHTGMDGHATAFYNPWFVMDTEAYDETLRTDFSMLAALADTKAEKTDALQAMLQEMLGDGTVYSETNAEKLQEIVSQAIAGFDRLATVEEILRAYDAAVEKMQAVQTLAGEAAELEDYKQRSKKELADSVNQKNYTKENWDLVQQIIEKANADIDAASKSATVSQVLARAKADIRKIAVKESPKALLIALIGAGVLVLGGAAVTGIVLKRKKKKHA